MEAESAGLGQIRLGNKPTHANKFRPNGKGVGNLPGSQDYKKAVEDNTGSLTKYDSMGKIVGE
jgi:hypothetical protein